MMRILRRLAGNQHGMLIVGIAIAMAALSVITLVVIAYSLGNLQAARHQAHLTSAKNAADSGMDVALGQLNEDGTCLTTGEVTLSSSSERTTKYQVETTGCPDDDVRFAKSTGRSYGPNGSLEAAQTVEATINQNQEFSASVQTGPGGLVMSGNAVVANGSVKVGGTIHLDGNAQIGTLLTPVNVDVPHIACPTPADASYPSQCASGTPITFSGSGQNNNAHVYGETCATNQGNTSSERFSDPGLVLPNCVANPVTLPDYDRAGQVASALAPVSAINCNTGTQVWPDNYRISGNVTINSNCTITLMGKVWIEGNLTLRGNIVVGVGLTTAPVVMIDGADGLAMAGSGKFIANALGTGAVIITYHSRLADGSPAPCCVSDSLTGPALAASEDYITISIGGATNASVGTAFYSHWTKIDVGGGVSVGSLVGQSIELRGGGNVSFGGGLLPTGEYWSFGEYKTTRDHLTP